MTQTLKKNFGKLIGVKVPACRDMGEQMNILKTALALLCLSATTAVAVPVQWDVDFSSDFGFSGEEVSASGSFIYDADTDQYSDISIDLVYSFLGVSATVDTVFAQFSNDVATFGEAASDLTRTVQLSLGSNLEGGLKNSGGIVGLGLLSVFVCEDKICASRTGFGTQALEASITGTPVSTIPLPATGALLAGAFGLLGWCRYRRNDA